MTQGYVNGPADGPRLIYGKINKNWQGSKPANDVGAGGSANDAKADFATNQHPDAQAWEEQRINSTADFLMYMIESEGVSASSLLNMDREELDDHVVDYIEYSPHATSDDYDAIIEELSEMEDSRASKIAAQKFYSTIPDDTRMQSLAENAYELASIPVASFDANPDLKIQWFEHMLEEYSDEDEAFDMTYDDYLDSGVGYADHEIAMEQAHEDVGTLVQEWADRNEKERGEPVFYHVSTEDFGWRNQSLSGLVDPEEFKQDPVLTIAPDTSDFNQTWQQAADGESLYISQSHHDSPMGESWYVKPVYREDLDAAGLEEGIDY